MESPRKNNDCYFYYYSTCLKGDGCLFRHEPSALGCETVCTFWQQGKCLNQHCNFRHMELRKNRKIIPCYWENQPGGCRKPHCSFLHKLPREPIGGELEKAKECDNVAAGKPLDRPEWPRRTVLAEGGQFEECVGSSDNDSTRVGPRRVSQSSEASYGSPPVDPLVVNFEEESDNESVPTSTPTKKPQRNIHVKTLEEIRLERIQAESAAFYSYDHNSEQIASNDLRSWIDTRKMYHKSAPDFKVLSLEEIRKTRFSKKNGEVNIGDDPVQNSCVSSHQQVEKNKLGSVIDSENNNGVEYFIGVENIKMEVEESSCATNGSSVTLPKVEGEDIGKSQINSNVKRSLLKRSHSPITFDTSPKTIASEINIKVEEQNFSVPDEDKIISEESSGDLKRTRDLDPLMEASQPPKRIRKLLRRTQEHEQTSRRRLRRGNVVNILDSSHAAHADLNSFKISEVSFQVPLVDKVDVADIGPLQDSPTVSGNLPQGSQNSGTCIIRSTISSNSELVTDNDPERELSLHPETIFPPVLDRSNRCSIESVDEEMYLDVQDSGMTLEADENILQDIDDLLKD